MHADSHYCISTLPNLLTDYVIFQRGLVRETHAVLIRISVLIILLLLLMILYYLLLLLIGLIALTLAITFFLNLLLEQLSVDLLSLL